MKRLCTVVLAVVALLAGPVLSQQTVEVIPLRHATVEQVLPTLRPLLEPGGALTGQSSQLIVRASAANIEEIRRALDAIDRPRRRLQISVRFDEAEERSRRRVETGARIGNRGSEVEIRADDMRRAGESRVDQRVQVLEGGRATILLGESRPVAVRERIQTPGGMTIGQDAIVMREATSGFDVVPRLAGRRVQLDIVPQRERFSGPAGTVEGQRVATTAAAPLGEWFEIGGAVEHAMSSGDGIGSMSQTRGSSSRRIWARVDEIAQ